MTVTDVPPADGPDDGAIAVIAGTGEPPLAGTVIVIEAVAAGVPGTPVALSVTVYTAFVVVLVFAGTVIVPLPLQLATEGSVSAAAVGGDDVALMLQLRALVVAKDAFTVPPLLEGIVVVVGVNDVIAAVGPT